MLLVTVAGACGGDDQIAAADVEFAIEHQRDRQRRMSFGEIAIPGDDALDLRAAA